MTATYSVPLTYQTPMHVESTMHFLTMEACGFVAEVTSQHAASFTACGSVMHSYMLAD